jgi:copper resistance protein B
MRRLFLLLPVVVAAPAHGQRLAYVPVSADEIAVPARVEYRPVEGDKTPTDGSEPRKLLRWGLLDRLEYAAQRGREGYAWDFSALLGEKRNRIWVATSGAGAAWQAPDELELYGIYSRNLGGNLDLNAGLRLDPLRPGRAYGVLAAQYDDQDRLWLGAFAYLSHKGETAMRVAGYYDVPIASGLVLQPSFELDAYGGDVPELGLGRGLGYAEAGLRLRYDFLDGKLAPYAGMSWSRDLGRTARMTRADGGDPETKSLILGLRSSF